MEKGELGAQEFVDHLGARPPFDALDVEDLSSAEDLSSRSGTVIGRQRLVRASVLAPGQTLVSKHCRPILWAAPATTVREAAQLIDQLQTSCILAETPQGVGIATDKDFRTLVATGRVPLNAPVADIVSAPVASVAHTTTVAAALLKMVETGVHHLAILDDTERPIGIVRAIDLGSVEVRDPLLIRSAVETASDLDGLMAAAAMLTPTLIELADSDVPALRVGALKTVIVEAILRRLLQLAPPPRTTMPAISWLVLGSLARHEPLPSSDVDTAIVWGAADIDALGRPVRDLSIDAAGIRDHASLVLNWMERCGLQRCPNGANADNPLFSRSVSSWTRRTEHWIAHPTSTGALLLSSMTADSRPFTHISLGRALTDTLRGTTQSLTFLETMLRYATAIRPPVGFVRGFVTDHRGEHRGGFDLKRGGLQPVTSLARWLALVLGDVSGSTIDRLNRARAAGLLTEGEADVLVGAYEDIYGLAFDWEISALRAGHAATTWIAPKTLDVLERRHLRESLRAVSTVQVSVANAWQRRLGQ